MDKATWDLHGWAGGEGVFAASCGSESKSFQRDWLAPSSKEFPGLGILRFSIDIFFHNASFARALVALLMRYMPGDMSYL